VAPSSDGSIRWITVLKLPPSGGASASEAFIWILAAVAILAYLFTVYLVSPLRKLAGVVERFGAGDLTARAQTKRTDELGNLARKTIRDLAREKVSSITVDEARLAKYAGVRKFHYGETDETVPLAAVLDWARPQSLPVVVIPGADHFFHHKLTVIKQLVMRALR
jgi:HAMP domain-containing protein